METVYLSGFSCWCWQRTDTYANRTSKWKLSTCPVSAVGVGNGQTHTRTGQVNGNCLLVRFQLLVLATDRHIRVRDNKWKLSTCPVSAVGVGNGQTHTRTRQYYLPVSAVGVGNGRQYAYATINGNCLLVRFQLLVLATDRHIRVRDNKWKLSTCPVSAVGVGNGQTHTLKPDK